MGDCRPGGVCVGLISRRCGFPAEAGGPIWADQGSRTCGRGHAHMHTRSDLPSTPHHMKHGSEARSAFAVAPRHNFYGNWQQRKHAKLCTSNAHFTSAAAARRGARLHRDARLRAISRSCAEARVRVAHGRRGRRGRGRRRGRRRTGRAPDPIVLMGKGGVAVEGSEEAAAGRPP